VLTVNVVDHPDSRNLHPEWGQESDPVDHLKDNIGPWLKSPLALHDHPWENGRATADPLDGQIALMLDR
jgi:hypothetical protein